jgi:hypothetical protein
LTVEKDTSAVPPSLQLPRTTGRLSGGGDGGLDFCFWLPAAQSDSEPLTAAWVTLEQSARRPLLPH